MWALPYAMLCYARCIDSGLWDPSGGSGVAGADEDDGVPSAEIDED